MYAILDIEATGGKKGEESIIEIAIYKYDGKDIIDQFISLVNPDRTIDPYVQRLTNITHKMVKSAPKFYEIAKRIVEITDQCILVGHNVAFDYRMLKQEYKKIGYDYTKELIDTLEYSKKLIPDIPSYSLGNLCKSLGIILTNKHRASGDARATLDLFRLLESKDSSKQIIKDNLLFKKVNSKYYHLLKDIPNVVGVFYLFNMNNEIIYLAKSKNISQTIHNIFTSKNSSSVKIRKYTSHIKYEITGCYIIARLKEASEISINKPLFNKNNKEAKL